MEGVSLLFVLLYNSLVAFLVTSVQSKGMHARAAWSLQCRLRNQRAPSGIADQCCHLGEFSELCSNKVLFKS